MVHDMVVFEIRRTYAEPKIRRRCVLGERGSEQGEVKIELRLRLLEASICNGKW
jgi:hypothetical protein